MRLVILDDYDKASDWAARYVKKRIHDFKPGPEKFFTLGLPTGNIRCSLDNHSFTVMSFIECEKNRYCIFLLLVDKIFVSDIYM